MNGVYRWKKISDNYVARHVENKDNCFYLMEYKPGAGPKHSKANSRIYNIKANKKDPANEKRLLFIKKAIQEFAGDLKIFLKYLLENNPSAKIGITFIPSSKTTDDSDYNHNLELVCDELKTLFKDKLHVEHPIQNKKSRYQSSKSNKERDSLHINDLKRNFKWVGFSQELDILIIFDDVIVTGSQFKAFKEFMLENMNKDNALIIYGLFWTLSQK